MIIVDNFRIILLVVGLISSGSGSGWPGVKVPSNAKVRKCYDSNWGANSAHGEVRECYGMDANACFFRMANNGLLDETGCNEKVNGDCSYWNLTDGQLKCGEARNGILKLCCCNSDACNDFSKYNKTVCEHMGEKFEGCARPTTDAASGLFQHYYGGLFPLVTLVAAFIHHFHPI